MMTPLRLHVRHGWVFSVGFASLQLDVALFGEFLPHECETGACISLGQGGNEVFFLLEHHYGPGLLMKDDTR